MYVTSYTSIAHAAKLIVQPTTNLHFRSDSLFPVPSGTKRHRIIVARVAFWHGLTSHDIVGPCRNRHVTRARYDALAAVRIAYPGMTFAAIARLFHRDHSTVRYGLKQRGLL